MIIENVMTFIYNEMEETDRNKMKESILGEQNNVFLKKETIYLYPFESIMKLNSTRGRLFVVQNWERIVQLPNFVNQSHYSNVFGFRCTSDNGFDSK